MSVLLERLRGGRMRTIVDAGSLYMTIRSNFNRKEKCKLNCFEGQKFFRFGNSWRRLSHDKAMVVVLNDDSEELIIL